MDDLAINDAGTRYLHEIPSPVLAREWLPQETRASTKRISANGRPTSFSRPLAFFVAMDGLAINDAGTRYLHEIPSPVLAREWLPQETRESTKRISANGRPNSFSRPLAFFVAMDDLAINDAGTRYLHERPSRVLAREWLPQEARESTKRISANGRPTSFSRPLAFFVAMDDVAINDAGTRYLHEIPSPVLAREWLPQETRESTKRIQRCGDTVPARDTKRINASGRPTSFSRPLVFFVAMDGLAINDAGTRYLREIRKELMPMVVPLPFRVLLRFLWQWMI